MLNQIYHISATAVLSFFSCSAYSLIETKLQIHKNDLKSAILLISIKSILQLYKVLACRPQVVCGEVTYQYRTTTTVSGNNSKL